MTRLTKYLTIGEIPSDYQSYLVGEINNNFCLFCHNLADGIEFNTSTRDRGHNLGDKEHIAHLCNKCSTAIHMSRHRNFSGNKELGSELVNRYLTTGNLPPDSMEHLHGNSKANQCVFCKKSLIHGPFKMDPSWTTIQIPIPFGKYIYPAGVMVCENCTEHLNRYGINRALESKYFMDSCPWCEGSYPIDDDELKYRKSNKTLGKHICGNCWILRLHKSVQDERVNLLTCDVCNFECYQDITQVIDPTISKLPKSDKVYCDKHIKLSVNPDIEQIWGTNSPKYFIRLLTPGDRAYFEIVDINKLDEVRFKSKPYLGVVFNPKSKDIAIFEANSKVAEIIAIEDEIKIPFPK